MSSKTLEISAQWKTYENETNCAGYEMHCWVLLSTHTVLVNHVSGAIRLCPFKSAGAGGYRGYHVVCTLQLTE